MGDRVRPRIVSAALVIAALLVPAAIAANAGPAGFKAEVKKDLKKLGKKAQTAKKKAKKANRRAKSALAGLEAVETTPGPAGEQGPPGADAISAMMGSAYLTGDKTDYVFPHQGNYPPDTGQPTIVGAEVLSPGHPITATGITARSLDAIADPGPLTLTLMVEGAASEVTCSIPAGETGCSAAVDVEIPASSLLAMRVVNGSPAPHVIQWAIDVV